MADKNIQMTQRNAGNTAWDNLFPLTKAENVQTADGSTAGQKFNDLASQSAGKGASMIGVQDANNRFIGTNVEAVLNELFQFANDGKTVVSNAVTAKGVAASPSDTFTTLATKIGQIKQQFLTEVSTANIFSRLNVSNVTARMCKKGDYVFFTYNYSGTVYLVKYTISSGNLVEFILPSPYNNDGGGAMAWWDNGNILVIHAIYRSGYNAQGQAILFFDPITNTFTTKNTKDINNTNGNGGFWTPRIIAIDGDTLHIPPCTYNRFQSGGSQIGGTEHSWKSITLSTGDMSANIWTKVSMPVSYGDALGTGPLRMYNGEYYVATSSYIFKWNPSTNTATTLYNSTTIFGYASDSSMCHLLLGSLNNYLYVGNGGNNAYMDWAKRFLLNGILDKSYPAFIFPYAYGCSCLDDEDTATIWAYRHAIVFKGATDGSQIALSQMLIKMKLIA